MLYVSLEKIGVETRGTSSAWLCLSSKSPSENSPHAALCRVSLASQSALTRTIVLFVTKVTKKSAQKVVEPTPSTTACETAPGCVHPSQEPASPLGFRRRPSAFARGLRPHPSGLLAMIDTTTYVANHSHDRRTPGTAHGTPPRTAHGTPPGTTPGTTHGTVQGTPPGTTHGTAPGTAHPKSCPRAAYFGTSLLSIRERVMV